MDVECEAGVLDVISQQAGTSGSRHRLLHRPLGFGILTADVEVSGLGAGGVPSDGHSLHDGKRIVLDQNPVLEGAGLALVGVADDVTGPIAGL